MQFVQPPGLFVCPFPKIFARRVIFAILPTNALTAVRVEPFQMHTLSKHRMKFAAFMVAYVITLYLVGLVLNNFWGNIVLIHFSAPLLTLGCLLIGSLCYFIRFYFYEHDRRLDSRV